MKNILKTTILTAILAGFMAQPVEAMQTVQKTPTWKKVAYVVGGLALVGGGIWYVYNNYYAEQPQENPVTKQPKKNIVPRTEEQLRLVALQKMATEVQEKGWKDVSAEEFSKMLSQIDIKTLQQDFAFPQDVKGCYELLKSWNGKLKTAADSVNNKQNVTEDQRKLWQDTLSVVTCLEGKLKTAQLFDKVLAYNNGELQKLYIKKNEQKYTSTEIALDLKTITPQEAVDVLEYYLQSTKDIIENKKKVQICLNKLAENKQLIINVLKYDKQKLKKYADSNRAIHDAYKEYLPKNEGTTKKETPKTTPQDTPAINFDSSKAPKVVKDLFNNIAASLTLFINQQYNDCIYLRMAINRDINDTAITSQIPTGSSHKEIVAQALQYKNVDGKTLKDLAAKTQYESEIHALYMRYKVQ